MTISDGHLHGLDQGVVSDGWAANHAEVDANPGVRDADVLIDGAQLADGGSSNFGTAVA